MANEYDRQMILELLPDGARRLIKAVAGEGIVKSPQAGNFISKYGLRAASSVKTSLQMLFRIYLTAKKIYPQICSDLHKSICEDEDTCWICGSQNAHYERGAGSRASTVVNQRKLLFLLFL